MVQLDINRNRNTGDPPELVIAEDGQRTTVELELPDDAVPGSSGYTHKLRRAAGQALNDHGVEFDTSQQRQRALTGLTQYHRRVEVRNGRVY